MTVAFLDDNFFFSTFSLKYPLIDCLEVYNSIGREKMIITTAKKLC